MSATSSGSDGGSTQTATPTSLSTSTVSLISSSTTPYATTTSDTASAKTITAFIILTSPSLTTLLSTITAPTVPPTLTSPATSNDSATAAQISPLLRIQIIASTILSGIIIIILLLLALFLCRHRRKRLPTKDENPESSPLPSPSATSTPPRHPLPVVNNGMQGRYPSIRPTAGEGAEFGALWLKNRNLESMPQPGRRTTMQASQVPMNIERWRSDPGPWFQRNQKGRPQNAVPRNQRISFPLEDEVPTLQAGPLRRSQTVVVRSPEQASFPFQEYEGWPLATPRRQQRDSGHLPRVSGLKSLGSMIEEVSGFYSSDDGMGTQIRGAIDSFISTSIDSSLERSSSDLGLRLQRGSAWERYQTRLMSPSTHGSSGGLPDDEGDRELEEEGDGVNWQLFDHSDHSSDFS